MTINVIDAAGATQAINTLPDTGVATAANSIPFVGAVEAITGTITHTNGSTGAAVVPLGTAVAGSFLEASTQGYNTLAVQITGTLTGVTLTVQGTIDNINWITIGTSRIQTFGGSVTGSSTVGLGIHYIDVTGLTKARVVSTASSLQSPLIPTNSSVAATMILASQTGMPSILGAISALSTVSIVTSANLGIPAPASSTTPDAASAALTTTGVTTTSTITPTFGCSYEVNIPVTVAVSGTNPTLDVVIQESDNSGTNWFDVYHFERITNTTGPSGNGTGVYRSPKLPLTGNRIRYVQTVGGTLPSFTRSINRLQSSDSASPFNRFFDRTLISTQASGATTAVFNVVNPTSNIQLIIDAGAITTTAPAFRLQGSEDGADWYNLSATTLTAAANSTVQLTIPDIHASFVRAAVATAGSGATLNYICIKAF